MLSDHVLIKPDYLFETSWEVCNKVGGIYTVISTKTLTLVNELKDNYILIGPDVWKETHQNPEFFEDKFLYKAWRLKAESEGLRIKVGRWNIPTKPVVILIDFTPYFSEKDAIFAWLWETYKLDSLTGGWDYIEPALFGYAAGKVIESFYNFNISQHDRIIAQFHEWMTGTGILYLKDKVPQVGTCFTTHATAVGRAIAGNGLPLYRDLTSYNGDKMAEYFNLIAKQSLEKISAEATDSFTTVSQITNNECRQFLGKEVDVVTPNGFEDTFVPEKEIYYEKRAVARLKLVKVTEAMINHPVPENSVFIIISGRYEFKNKGIDLFIDSLGKLNKLPLERNIIAFLTIPAYQTGPRQQLLDRIDKADFKEPVTGEFLTHGLHEPENDPILKRIQINDLHNRPEDKVKVLFVPAYLNGTDGIFNLGYYDFLIGFDGSIFPSYYEPWGYTPLESLAFHIPTITTTLSGFGQWVKSSNPKHGEGIAIINRDDNNDAYVIDEIVKTVQHDCSKSEEEILNMRENAYDISRLALWSNFVNFYHEAYSVALEKVSLRSDLFRSKQPQVHSFSVSQAIEAKPEWKKILVQPSVPENLEGLLRITKNLWWTWNPEGAELFEMIDKEKWVQNKNNPISLIESLTYQDLQKLSKNTKFLEKLHTATEHFDGYMAKAAEKPSKTVAYFSMEFGLHDTLKIFSGGLGMLAGDYLKEASDSNYNIIGVGILYRYGYFQQKISITGEQIASYTPQKFAHLPLIPVRDENNNWLKITFALPGRTMYAKIWRVDVGRVPLYLLDTDIDENIENDRVITHQLYGGDLENRLRQEILLGIGGIRGLEILGIKPDIYHLNEGHSAFIGIERLSNLIRENKLTFFQALEVVRSSTLFTTHTPVPAGHDTFTEDLMRRYLSHYPERLNIKWEQFIHLGRISETDPEEKFSMSILAAKLSQEINAVSRIHCEVTRQMFQKLYPGYYPHELHIGYVTNGVHYPTWTATTWQKLYQRQFGEGFLTDQSNPDHWKAILQVDDEVIWKTRLVLKSHLVEYLLDRIYEEMTRRNENPKLIFSIKESIPRNALIIGFARRFATYKRAYMLFSNPGRLSKIVNNKERPVVFMFAGKAHPQDKAGQELIKQIYEISKTPEFQGKIFFVENYDMELAKYLIQGVDIWLNTPERKMEASGTSGEKAVMNGVVNFSVLDGWWAEGYRENAGWAIPEAATYSNSLIQDDLDAETIYSTLEEDIIPLYFDVNSKKVPVKWVSNIKNTISGIAPHYTMKRQLDDYIRMFYNKLLQRSEKMNVKNFEMARHLASWKRNVIRGWDSIEVVSLNIPDSTQKPLVLGETFRAEIVLDMNELSGTDLGVEVLFGIKENDEIAEPVRIYEMTLKSSEKNHVTYSCDIELDQPGVHNYVFRLFPKNSLLPHRQDFNLVKWI